MPFCTLAGKLLGDSSNDEKGFPRGFRKGKGGVSEGFPRVSGGFHSGYPGEQGVNHMGIPVFRRLAQTEKPG